MYLCLCHGITDHQVKQLSAEGTRSTAQVYSHFGVRPKCGKCVPYVRELVKGEVKVESACCGKCQCG